MAPKRKTAAKKKAAASSSSSWKTTPGAQPLPSPPPSSSATPLPPDPPSSGPEAADKVKDQGNIAFKGGRYAEAIDLYTEAIELHGQETSYWTNRAASYMALKRFAPAQADCQQALFILGSSAPTSALTKILLRLARCQYAQGTTSPALSTLARLLELDPGNTPALQLKQKIAALDRHADNFQAARARGDWGMARLALDKCVQAVEVEGGEIPGEWRLWKVELELARANWDAAGIGANEALRFSPHSPDALALRGLVLFLTGKLPQALQHVSSALRYDPGHEKAQKLRKRVKEVEKLKEEGNSAFKDGKLNEAADKYTEALEKIGQSEEEGNGGQIRATLLSNRATSLLKLKRYEDALQDVDDSLTLAPHSFKALRTRARINLFLESYDGAIADFKSAIKEAGAEGNGSDADVRALRQELKKAEVELKRSKTKDYYKILGVHKECTEVEIKKAYRKESLIHHPDKGGDEEKFKLASEAYAVLSDSEKRRRYDLGEDDESGFGDDMGGMHGHGMHGMSHVDLAGLFSQFHGFPGGAGGGGGRRGSSGMGGFPF